MVDLSISRNSNTSRGHHCILSRKYFSIASLDREKLENHNDLYSMAFALKGTVLKIVKEKSNLYLRSWSLRNAVSRALRLRVRVREVLRRKG